MDKKTQNSQDPHRSSILSENARSWGITDNMTYADGYNTIKKTIIEHAAAILASNGWKTATLSFEYDWNSDDDSEDEGWSATADVGLMLAGTKIESDEKVCMSLFWSEHDSERDDNGLYPADMNNTDKSCLRSLQEYLLRAYSFLGMFFEYGHKKSLVVLK